MTGIVFWQDANPNTDAISLEFSYMLFNQVVKDSGSYDWTIVEQKLNEIASRDHQAIFRFRYTYVGKKTSVPDYIKSRSDYQETEGVSEGQTTWFPDWRNKELQRFTLEFYTKFAERYDHDSRLAFIQVGFGLWGEYHIYDGPFILGRTFPSKLFQEKFFYHLDSVWQNTPWSISIDAADDTYSPFKDNPKLLNLKFGNFDDSFMSSDHSGYNERCWDFFSEERYDESPAGGEFNYYTSYDQQHVLDYPNGAHGLSYEAEAAKFHISYMIGNDQPKYQPMSRIKEASLASGYKFKIVSVSTKSDSSVIVIRNVGIAPFYYDAYPTVNGIRSYETLKNLPPGESREFHVSAGGDPFNLTIESDRLLPDQRIEYIGTTSVSATGSLLETGKWKVFPSIASKGTEISMINNNSCQHQKTLIHIFNEMGILIYSKQVETAKNVINTSSLDRGIYFMKIQQSNQPNLIKRIIIY